jgi:aryl-alcohol dehydrogenase-like predicted oxidoreductase
MTLSRRSAIKLGVGLGAVAFFDRRPLLARQEAGLITKAIPSSGERIPVIGLGSARTFNLDPSSPEAAEPLEVVRLFHEHGGTVIDTAPSYGRAEAFVGRAVAGIGAADALFLATKVNVEGRGVDAALAQMEASSRVLGKRRLDLMQVWNLGDNFRSLGDRHLAEHLEAAREWKRRGRTRHIGITTSFPQQYALMEAALRREELDFVQIDYSIGDRVPEERLLPLAADRGAAVLINQPFSTGGLFSRVVGRMLPSWAAEFDCASWAQFFLKYIVSHPAVTCAIPATSDPEHLVDNMGACVGRLPDERTRRRMVEVFQAL